MKKRTVAVSRTLVTRRVSEGCFSTRCLSSPSLTLRVSISRGTEVLKLLVAVSAVPLVVMCGALPLFAASKPNVILIMADDVSYDQFGCYGNEQLKTPRLDKLAKTGAKFNHCYSLPLCTPSRVKIMTGRDNIRNYIGFGQLDPREITFGTMMKKAGYATAVTGKWQLRRGEKGSLAPDCGFDTYCLWHYPGTNRQRYWKPSLMRDGKLVPVDENSFGPDINTDFIIEFIEKHKGRPFFVYYPSILMHGPATSTPDIRAPDKKGRDAKWAAMANRLDKNIGRIVDALEKNGLRENTVILFTTDNGNCGHATYTFRGETRETEKGNPTDGGTHAPLIVNCPGIVPEGLVIDDLVDFSDFLPTIADISGAALPDVTLDGRSFWPQCQGEKGNPRDWIFQCWFPKGEHALELYGAGRLYLIWAQDQRYKLYSHGKFIEIADRLETTNIPPGTGSAEAEAAHRKLRAAIDSMPKSNPHMVQQEKSGKDRRGRKKKSQKREAQ